MILGLINMLAFVAEMVHILDFPIGSEKNFDHYNFEWVHIALFLIALIYIVLIFFVIIVLTQTTFRYWTQVDQLGMSKSSLTDMSSETALDEYERSKVA